MRSFVQDEVKGVVKQSFDAEKATSIFDPAQTGAAEVWLSGLIAHGEWRKLIYELSEENKSSLVLNYIIKASGAHMRARARDRSPSLSLPFPRSSSSPSSLSLSLSLFLFLSPGLPPALPPPPPTITTHTHTQPSIWRDCPHGLKQWRRTRDKRNKSVYIADLPLAPPSPLPSDPDRASA